MTMPMLGHSASVREKFESAVSTLAAKGKPFLGYMFSTGNNECGYVVEVTGKRPVFDAKWVVTYSKGNSTKKTVTWSGKRFACDYARDLKRKYGYDVQIEQVYVRRKCVTKAARRMEFMMQGLRLQGKLLGVVRSDDGLNITSEAM